jgi:hypothetical protein
VTTTAAEVVELARTRYGQVGVVELGKVYASLPDTDPRIARQVVLTPPPVAGFATGMLPASTIRRVGPAPADLLRINIYDPRCGVGMSLVDGARRLAYAYARRIAGDARTADELAAFVLPQVICDCVYGMDSDPLAVQLARLALSLETDGQVSAQALEANIVCGDHGAGDQPPAKRQRRNTVDLIPGARTAA